MHLVSKQAFLKCLCTTAQRELAIRMRQEGYIIRMTNTDPEARKEAQEYEANIPFAVEDGIITQL